MKKNVFMIICTFALLFFSACKGFFSGTEFVDSLSNEIIRAQSDYSKVTISVDSVSTKSIIPVAGVYEKDYKVTDEITIVFEPYPEYYFSYWEITPEDSIELLETKTENNIITAVVKILKTADITIKPVCEHSKQLNISFKSENANLSPSVPKSYVTGDVFTLECLEDDDYYFYNWQVFLAEDEENALEDFSSYLKFENIDSRTTQVEILGVDADIIISPLLIKRPKIVSSSPVYDSNGSFRDSRIVVMFDHEMDESSIYFTEDEIQELQAKNYTVLKQAETENAYAYLDENGQKFYKNISITQSTKDGVNLAKYFTIPCFDEDNKSTLRISANRDLLPPGAIDIFVTISKNFNRYDSKSELYISLSNEYSYSFRTGSRMDNYAPFIGKIDDSEDDVVLRIVPQEEAGKQNVVYNKEWLAIPNILGESSSFIKQFDCQSEKLWLCCRVGDGDSGVSKVELEIDQKLVTYIDASFDTAYGLGWVKTTKEVCNISEAKGANQRVNKIVDIAGFTRASSYDTWAHIYEVVVVVTDYSGNITKSKPFYFYMGWVDPEE